MLTIPSVKELFKAGAHFGHGRNRTDARAHGYVFTYRNKIAVIDLEKTQAGLEKALGFLAGQAKNGASFLFVGTKVQARELVKELAENLKQGYVVERWPGGLLTNFDEVAKSVKRMLKVEKDIAENKYDNLTKKERLMIERGLKKKQFTFGGLRYLEKKPDVVIVIDAKEEHIAVAEANNSKIPVVAVCDTNANPKIIDYPIPANDDSQKTIEVILSLIKEAIEKNYKQKTGEPEKKVEERIEKTIEKKSGVKKEENGKDKKTSGKDRRGSDGSKKSA